MQTFYSIILYCTAILSFCTYYSLLALCIRLGQPRLHCMTSHGPMNQTTNSIELEQRFQLNTCMNLFQTSICNQFMLYSSFTSLGHLIYPISVTCIINCISAICPCRHSRIQMPLKEGLYFKQVLQAYVKFFTCPVHESVFFMYWY